MIRFKNHNRAPGFMLTEVLLSLAIVGIVLTPLFGLQSQIFRSLFGLSGRIQRLFAMENFLIASRHTLLHEQGENNKQEKKITEPSATMRYEAKKVTDDPIFRKMPGIMQEETECVWQEGFRTRREIIVTFVYKPEKRARES